MKAKIVIFVVMLLLSLCSFSIIVSAAGPNYMGFYETPKDVTVGASFTTIVWVDVAHQIDTASVDNLTFLPAGILHYTSTAKGNLFAGTTVWLTPEDSGVINNASGYANPITWAYTTPVNNTNKTLATITWLAYGCGEATLTISEGGTADGGLDPGTTKYTGTVNVHPMAVTAFTATGYNSTQINLTWTKHTGDDTVLVRYRVDHAPTSVTDGTELYNDTGTSTEDDGLSPGDHVYYSAWGYNETGNLYSLMYVSDDAATSEAPVFGTPNPTNNSVNRPTAFTWGISITDPELDLITWSIECSNGQSSSGTSVGGTKTLALTGLDFSTEYNVWVNATDGYSDTNATYIFTTADNGAPEEPDGGSPGNPEDTTPINDAPNIPISIGFLRVVVTDPEGQTMDVSFYWGNDTLIGTDASVTSGTTATIAIPMLNYSTTYYWYVNITDTEGAWTRGPNTGNWSYTTASRSSGDIGTTISFHNIYITVVDDTTSLPIMNANCNVKANTDSTLSHLSDEGLTDQYGVWSSNIRDGYTYQLTIVINGYNNYASTFTMEHTDVHLTVRMTQSIGAAGLTDARGGLTTTGLIVIAVGALAIAGIAGLWYMDKKR